jgi:hypothetical protein
VALHFRLSARDWRPRLECRRRRARMRRGRRIPRHAAKRPRPPDRGNRQLPARPGDRRQGGEAPHLTRPARWGEPMAATGEKPMAVDRWSSAADWHRTADRRSVVCVRQRPCEGEGALACAHGHDSRNGSHTGATVGVRGGSTGTCADRKWITPRASDSAVPARRWAEDTAVAASGEGAGSDR